MARLPVKFLYGMDTLTFGREVAAKRMAKNFADRLRAGIHPEDAADLADMLDAAAHGEALTIAMGFASSGAPSEFERDWAIYDRVEELRKDLPSYEACYRRVADSHHLSRDRVKKIHLKMRVAWEEARAGE